jgi:(p)ppGpp synthase/HD superfamily hydrolase
MIEKAIQIACEAHRGQVDKGGEPYILHPLRVMMQMTDNESRIIAVLHDVAEDSGYSIENLSYTFDEDIGFAIERLTRRQGEDYLQYISRCNMNKTTRLIKTADLRDNLSVNRMAKLDEATQVRLCKKYFKALEILNG